MSRKKTVQPSAAEVAFNLFAKLSKDEQLEFASSTYGVALDDALTQARREVRERGAQVSLNGQ